MDTLDRLRQDDGMATTWLPSIGTRRLDHARVPTIADAELLAGVGVGGTETPDTIDLLAFVGLSTHPGTTIRATRVTNSPGSS